MKSKTSSTGYYCGPKWLHHLMQSNSRPDPKYRHYKPKDLAFVRVNGRDHYLGKHGTPESWERYYRLLAEWRTSGAAVEVQPQTAPPPAEAPSVAEVILGFWRHAEQHYRRADGTPTGELDNFRASLRPLRKLFGTTPAGDFGPKALKLCRQAMIEAGLARTTINQRIGRIVHVFKWAVENELVPPSVHHGLKAVQGLQKGRTAAREPAPVKPVPETFVDALRPYVARQVWAMIELQRLTGMRPGEVTIMRTGDLDTSGRAWTYTPASHKAEHHGKGRTIYLGPRAQEVVKPWLRTDLTAYLFSPKEAMAEFRAGQRRDRKTPLYPSVLARPRVAKPKRQLRDHYSVRSYQHAVGYGCRRADVPAWHPHQLRHNAATRLRKEFGLDAARAILGHSSHTTAEIYAELDREQAASIMERVG